MWTRVAACFSLSISLGGCCGDVLLDPRFFDAGLNDGSLPPGADALPRDTGTGFPAMPNVGPQVDRVGRPLITTLLVAPFDDPGTRDQRRGAFNGAPPAQWAQAETELRTSQAAFDGIDRQCANQILATNANTAERYGPLATILADDQLWVNADGVECRFYFAVELSATVVPGIEDQCGGRTPGMDVVDAMYSLLAAGQLDNAVEDGVDMDSVFHDDQTFPFLADP